MAEKAKKSSATAQENKKRTSDSNEEKTTAASPTEWAQTVMNQLIEAQKTWFEIASQQNALLLETVGKVTNYRQNAPTEVLSDWARQGVEGFIEAQKRWSEIAVQQSGQILKALQSNASLPNFNQAGNDYQNAGGQGIAALVKMRGEWLDFVAQQNSQAISVMKQSLNLDESSPAAALADFAQQAVDNYIEVQKRWLDLAMQLPFLGGAADESKK